MRWKKEYELFLSYVLSSFLRVPIITSSLAIIVSDVTTCASVQPEKRVFPQEGLLAICTAKVKRETSPGAIRCECELIPV